MFIDLTHATPSALTLLKGIDVHLLHKGSLLHFSDRFKEYFARQTNSFIEHTKNRCTQYVHVCKIMYRKSQKHISYSNKNSQLQQIEWMIMLVASGESNTIRPRRMSRTNPAQTISSVL